MFAKKAERCRSVFLNGIHQKAVMTWMLTPSIDEGFMGCVFDAPDKFSNPVLSIPLIF